MSLTLEELKELLADRYDPELLLETLGITSKELLDAFEEKLVQYRYRFGDEEEEFESDEQ